MSLKVLITNITMAGRTGTEINVRDLVQELFRRGHAPVVYSPHLGEITHDIRAATIPVIENISLISETPDIIHEHHHPAISERAQAWRTTRTPSEREAFASVVGDLLDALRYEP